MSSKLLLIAGSVALVFATACAGSSAPNNDVTAAGGSATSVPSPPPTGGMNSGGASGNEGLGGEVGQDLLFFPEGLPNTRRDSGGSLTLVAFTLKQGATGLELYAAVENEGDSPVCNAGMMTYFYDTADQLVATSGSTLHSGRIYRMDGGAGVAVACVAPGEIAMAGSQELPEEVVLEELGYLQHGFPAFILGDLIRLEGIELGELQSIDQGTGTSYAGTLQNGLDVAASDAKVSVFPVNRVGRPLGVTTASADADIPPGGAWSFETNTVDDPGVDHAAYPAVSIAP